MVEESCKAGKRKRCQDEAEVGRKTHELIDSDDEGTVGQRAQCDQEGDKDVATVAQKAEELIDSDDELLVA